MPLLLTQAITECPSSKEIISHWLTE